jgi:hypothetical protein
VNPMRVLASGPLSLGWPGVVGLGMIVSVAGFWLSTLRPEQSRLEDLLAQVVTARTERLTAANDPRALRSPSEKLAVFYGSFPKPSQVPDLLGKIFASASAEGLQLEQGEYHIAPHNADALAQFQLTLPVRGPYPQIRRFLDAAMLEIP